MWDWKQILAEIRAFISSHGETDSNAEIVNAYITRSVIRDRKYQASLYHSKGNTDLEQPICDTNNSSNGGECYENEVSQALSKVDLEEDISCGLDVKEKINQVNEFTTVDVKVDADSLNFNSFIGGDLDCSADLMESMGLPVAFGSKRGKSRKEQQLSEKQIRNRFTDTWEEHGALLVYKSFVTIYPDYANIYDQITGSIPPCEEVEIMCVNECDDKEETKNTEETTNCNNSNTIEIGNGSLLNEGGDSLVGCSNVKNNITSAQPGSSGDASSPDSDECVSNGCETSKSHLYSFNNEHSYGSVGENARISTNQEQVMKYETECVEGDGSENCYSHEELLVILRDTHQDLENQIYWHAKETISEWYRKNPSVDFDISSLDEDLMAITSPYLEQGVEDEVGEGEVVEGYHIDDEEYEDYYSTYAEEKDGDLFEEDGTAKDVSLTDALEMCGLAVQKDVAIRNQRKRRIVHGTVTYKRKNIAQEAKRLHLDLDFKPKHILFDEDGDPIEIKDNEIEDESLETEQTGRSKFDHSQSDGVDTSNTAEAQESDSDSEPEEIPINHTAKAICRSKSLSNLSEELLDFCPLTSAKSCEDSLSTLTGEKKKAIQKQRLEVNKEKETITVLEKVDIQRKKKKKKKRRQNCTDDGHPARSDPQTSKYWYQRYLLFSRFDDGIQMDAESWYSVTPEAIAAHHAKRCQGRYVLDGFCGAGGNVIQFAMFGCKVIAIDIDEEKIKLARHNAGVYGVENEIEFITGDFMEIAPKYAGIVDMIFLSPPWGGPDYIKQDVYDAENMNATKLLEVSRCVTENIALFMPKNSCATQIITLAGEGKRVEIEQNFLDSKVKALTAYFGDLVMSGGDS